MDSSIVAVTVYPDRARVTRRGTVNLEEGTHELRVADLTLLLDPESLRATGKGTARVRMLGVDVRREYYTETPSVPAAELAHQLQEKLDMDQALQDEASLLDSQLGMLGSMATHAGESLSRGIGRGRAKVADGTALLSFLGTHHSQLSARKREIAVQRRELDSQIHVLKSELARIKGAQPCERFVAIVGVQVLSAGEFTLDLVYTTRGGAQWQPLYDLRLLEEEDEPCIELTYLGQVQQSTGEDWHDVSLTLSTARPAVSAQLPELTPWYVRLFQPPEMPRRRAVRMARKAEFGDMLADVAEAEPFEGATPPPAPEVVAAETTQAQVDTTGTAVTFHLPLQVDIPADNTPHKATIQVLRFVPQLDFLAVPKVVDEVYRRARVTNDSDVTLLPGPVTLFHGGEFIGRAKMDKVAPQETFETTLGIEDRVKVQRDLVLKEVGKQLIGDRRVLRYGYHIEVQNLLPRPANLVVADQVPVSGHENIKVKVESLDPPPAEHTEQGRLNWELALEPQQSRNMRFEFTVSAPRGDRLQGLPED